MDSNDAEKLKGAIEKHKATIPESDSLAKAKTKLAELEAVL